MFYFINFYLFISDKDKFNIISINKNINEIDSANKDHLIYDENDITIVHSQGIYYISYMFNYYIYINISL